METIEGMRKLELTLHLVKEEMGEAIADLKKERDGLLEETESLYKRIGTLKHMIGVRDSDIRRINKHNRAERDRLLLLVEALRSLLRPVEETNDDA